MSTDRDTTRILRSWLRMDEHESADRVLDDVLALLDATPQRRPMWPARRIADMNSYAKFAIAAAALLAIAVVGINLLPRSGNGIGGPVPTAVQSPSSSPAASASPSTSPGPFPAAGALTVGTHSIRQNGAEYAIDIPAAGWTSSGVQVPPDGGTIQKGTLGVRNAAWLLFWTIDGVFIDPCGQVPGPVVSTSTADLAQAVATIPGLDVTEPEDVTLGGLPAKYLLVTVPRELPCAPSDFYLWYDDVTCGADDPCGRWVSAPESKIEVWIVDLGGRHVWIEAETYKGADPEIEQEIQQMIDSIRFE